MATKNSKRPLTIGALAERSGVGVETIRFYERKGLIEQPNRPLGSVRVYPEQAVERLEFVHHAQELGFTLREIKDLLTLQADPNADCATVRGRAAEKLDEVESRLSQLVRMRATLRQLVSACPGQGDLDNCSIVDALSAKDHQATQSAPHSSTERTKDMKSATLHIEGMHCQGCAKTIEALLTGEAGVKSLAVSFPDRRATVMYDPELIDAVRLAAAVNRVGYRATVAS